MIRCAVSLILACLLLSAAGCAAYHPLPLDEGAEARSLAPPDWERITVDAGRIRHPRLEPLRVGLEDGLSPEEAAVVAVVSNPRLRAVRDQRGLARAQVIQAGLLPNPQVSYGKDIPAAGSPPDTVTAYAAELSWDGLLALFNRDLNRRAARAEAEAVDLEVAWQEWQVAEEARMQTIRLLVLREALPLAGRIAEGRQRWLDALEMARLTGDASGTLAAQARMACDQARREEITFQEAEEEARLGLNEALGVPPSEQVPLQDGAALPRWDSLPDAEALSQDLGRTRIDLLALRKGYESQDARLRLAVREQFSPIGLAANVARDTGNILTRGFLAALDLPFFDRNQGQVAWEEASRRQLYDEYGARLFEARAQVAYLRAGLEGTRLRLQSAEDTAPALDETAEATREALDRGAADLASWQEAQGAALEQALLVLSLRAELAQAGLALEVASGRYLAGTDADGQPSPKEIP